MLQKIPLRNRILFAQCDGIIDIPSLDSIPSTVSLYCNGIVPPTGPIALVQTGTLNALVQTGTLNALVQTES